MKHVQATYVLPSNKISHLQATLPSTMLQLGDAWILGAADPALLLGDGKEPLQQRLEHLNQRSDEVRMGQLDVGNGKGPGC